MRDDKAVSQPSIVVAIALAATLLAWAENALAPWAPYYAVYAFAITLLPLWLGAYRFGPLSSVRWWGWPGAVLLALLMQVAIGLLVGVAYPALLDGVGVGAAAASEVFWSMPAALGELFAAAASRLGGTAAGHMAAYLAFITLWAAFGEELFYRGLVQGSLRRRWGFAAAATVANLLFALRHATQLVLVTPYPWGAAAAWVVVSFLAGFVFAWLYERTGSLWLPVTCHYAFNLVPWLVGGVG